MGVLGIVYMYTSKTSQKSYIGQTMHSLKRRKSSGYSAHFNNAIRKYGWNDFESKILGKYPQDQLNEMESHWISFYDTVNNGYNCTVGGNGSRGYKQSKETIDKKSTRIVQYDLHGNVINRFSSINEAMRLTKIRHIHECVIGKSNYHSSGGFVWKKANEKFEFSKDKYNNSGYKCKIASYTKDGQCVEKYDSINEAGRILGISSSHIVETCKGTRKSAGGFVWKYLQSKGE